MDGTQQSSKMAESNFDFFTSLYFALKISVNNIFSSRSNSESLEGVWMISFVLFSSLARAY